MSAPGTPKASQAAITAVQEALDAHWIDWMDQENYRGFGCICGETFGRDESGARWVHVAQSVADAAAPHNAADALRGAARDPELRLGGHSGVSIRGLRHRADRIEAAQ